VAEANDYLLQFRKANEPWQSGNVPIVLVTPFQPQIATFSKKM
jgi:hypothetical protein